MCIRDRNQAAAQQPEAQPEQDPVEQLNEKFPPAKVEELIAVSYTHLGK